MSRVRLIIKCWAAGGAGGQHTEQNHGGAGGFAQAEFSIPRYSSPEDAQSQQSDASRLSSRPLKAGKTSSSSSSSSSSSADAGNLDTISVAAVDGSEIHCNGTILKITVGGGGECKADYHAAGNGFPNGGGAKGDYFAGGGGGSSHVRVRKQVIKNCASLSGHQRQLQHGEQQQQQQQQQEDGDAVMTSRSKTGASKAAPTGRRVVRNGRSPASGAGSGSASAALVSQAGRSRKRKISSSGGAGGSSAAAATTATGDTSSAAATDESDTDNWAVIIGAGGGGGGSGGANGSGTGGGGGGGGGTLDGLVGVGGDGENHNNNDGLVGVNGGGGGGRGHNQSGCYTSDAGGAGGERGQPGESRNGAGGRAGLPTGGSGGGGGASSFLCEARGSAYCVDATDERAVNFDDPHSGYRGAKGERHGPGHGGKHGKGDGGDGRVVIIHKSSGEIFVYDEPGDYEFSCSVCGPDIIPLARSFTRVVESGWPGDAVPHDKRSAVPVAIHPDIIRIRAPKLSVLLEQPPVHAPFTSFPQMETSTARAAIISFYAYIYADMLPLHTTSPGGNDDDEVERARLSSDQLVAVLDAAHRFGLARLSAHCLVELKDRFKFEEVLPLVLSLRDSGTAHELTGPALRPLLLRAAVERARIAPDIVALFVEDSGFMVDLARSLALQLDRSLLTVSDAGAMPDSSFVLDMRRLFTAGGGDIRLLPALPPLSEDGAPCAPVEDSPPVLAHRAVLAARSPFFRGVLEPGRFTEAAAGSVRCEFVNISALRRLIRFFYVGFGQEASDTTTNPKEESDAYDDSVISRSDALFLNSAVPYYYAADAAHLPEEATALLQKCQEAVIIDVTPQTVLSALVESHFASGSDGATSSLLEYAIQHYGELDETELQALPIELLSVLSALAVRRLYSLCTCGSQTEKQLLLAEKRR